MNLLKYINDLPKRASLAAATKKSPDYLWQVATSRRRASPELARAIDLATDGQVSRAELRPDLWGDEPKRRKAA